MTWRVILGAALLVASGAAGLSASAESLRIAYIEPLSGDRASVGEDGLRYFRYISDQLNAKGGVLGMPVEIVPYDGKLNPQETLVQVQKAIDAGVRIITQGNGSSVAAAIEDFVAKYNDRNPGNEVIYLNYAAVDPVLTNEKCSYWHFRWDANSDIKMEALTNYMRSRESIKKVYLINQDYSFGQAVRAEALKMLKEKRPDLQIVGDELHPLQKITDFAPYIAKIRASGADSVITGNWGQDFALLVKAAADAGLQVDWYTYYANGVGGPTAIKQANLKDRVFEIAEGVANDPYAPAQDTEKAFRAKVGQSNRYPRIFNQMEMLVKAIEQTKSTDPRKIAPALEDMKLAVLNGGEGFMRSDDHQFFQPMYVAVFGPRNPVQPFDEENTDWGWKTVARIDTDSTMVPSTCQMAHPS